MTQQIFTASGPFTVPEFSTLTIDLWGDGASGGSVGPNNVNGNPGIGSSISPLGLIAPGGLPGTHGYAAVGAGGFGQTPTGGDINTPGTPGATSTLSPSRGGAGGQAPSGGGGGQPGSVDRSNGNPGAPFGGGGSGASGVSPNGQGSGGGGGSGSHLTKTFSNNVGLPVGTILQVSIGPGGPAASDTTSNSGAGAPGGAIISWVPASPQSGNYFTTGAEQSQTVPVTQASSTQWATVYAVQLRNLALGEILQVDASNETRNDAGYNVEFVTQTIITPTLPISSEDLPAGAKMLGPLNGSDVNPEMHYSTPTKAFIYKTDQAWTNPWIVFRVRARSTAATGNEICTIMQGYGSLSVLISPSA